MSVCVRAPVGAVVAIHFILHSPCRGGGDAPLTQADRGGAARSAATATGSGLGGTAAAGGESAVSGRRGERTARHWREHTLEHRGPGHARPNGMYVCARVVCVLRGGRRASGGHLLVRGGSRVHGDRARVYVCDRRDGEPQPPHACREETRATPLPPHVCWCVCSQRGTGPGVVLRLQRMTD